jgi:glycosyltransferase involved in cell wall biosynthesis
MTAVHQLLPTATPHDAITGQAFAWRDLLRGWGYESEIVAEHVHPDLNDEVRRLDRTARRMLDDNAIVLRYAIWSKTIDIAMQRPERVALCYHNITPGQFLRPFNSELAELCDRGRRALGGLPAPAALIADSEFNAGDLQAAGLGRATIVPLLLDLPETEARVHGVAENPIILTVGRVVPNKRLEDVVKAFALYQRHRAPGARLVLIGSARGFENYRRALEHLIERIGVEQIFFTGPISSEARDAWYTRADAYLSMSVHEGFSAPVVEALAYGTPVVARAAGALPETLAGAGVVLDGEDLPLVAEALHEVVSSPETRKALAEAAAFRLKDLRPEAVAPRIRAALAPVLDGA